MFSEGLVHDPFDHEMMMVVRGNDGPVVLTGYSHSGATGIDPAALEFVLRQINGQAG